MTTYTIVFEDETELNGLSYEESEAAMVASETNGNRWTRIFPEFTEEAFSHNCSVSD